MFDRLEKPFLTVETGEAYQPIRLNYHVNDKERLVNTFAKMKCIRMNANRLSWAWYWQDESESLDFASIDSYKKTPEKQIRIGTFTLKDNQLVLDLPSFKRACIAVTFFHKAIPNQLMQIHHADFVNKVFGLNERVRHGFAELFNQRELENILKEREDLFHEVQEKCANAESEDEAWSILEEYTKEENQKPLPFAERYSFVDQEGDEVESDPENKFLSFYIYLRSREIVAIKRWVGDSGYQVTDAIDEAMESVFGNVDIDVD